jgi:hypothetical protein
MQRTFDARALREQFPTLGRKHNGRNVVYLDGPGGSQVARSAIDAVSRYMNRGGANLHGAFHASREAGHPGQGRLDPCRLGPVQHRRRDRWIYPITAGFCGEGLEALKMEGARVAARG